MPRPGRKRSVFFVQMPAQCIDFVLVWETHFEQNNSNKREENEAKEKRRIFERNLEEEGLFLDHEHLEDSSLNFIKIHCPMEVLRRYTEILRLRMPMKEVDEEFVSGTGHAKDTAVSVIPIPRFSKCLNWLQKNFGIDRTKFPSTNQRLNAIYSRDKEYLFDVTEPDFFSSGVRERIVDFIIRRKRFSDDPTDDFAFGIDRLINDKVYTAAYPLHDGDLKTPGSMRHMLYTEWASLKKCHRVQPLDHIKEYFGVNIGLYFAWLGYYTRMLIPAAILGFVCFFYGIGTLERDTYSSKICSGIEDKNQTYVMCPLCVQQCRYWDLSTTCKYAKFTYIFDNEATVGFAVLMSFWAAIFLEFWKRYSARITHKWDLSTFDKTEEQPRLEYLSRLKRLKKLEDDVAAIKTEPQVSFWRTRLPFTLLSLSSVLFLLLMAGAVIVAVIAYRVFVSIALFRVYPNNQSEMSMLVSASAAVMNLFMICIFNFIYSFVAESLTDMELHRTQSEFDDSLILKIYLLQFVNYYASIFYIAFFKGRFVGPPNEAPSNYLERERCGPAGCMTELSIQLAIIMVGKQAVNCVLEMGGPLIFKWIKQFRLTFASKKKSTRRPHFATQWAKDYRLLAWHSRSLFGEYLEMVLQYGFVTIFVAAFPLAPFFALLNNILEMRLDATKMLRYNRRPVGQRVKDIGIWYGILDSVSRVAVISNALIIAFTSHLIPKILYYFDQEVKSTGRSMEGFLHHSLVSFNISEFNDDTVPIIDTNYQMFQRANETKVCWYEAYNYNHTDYRHYKRTSFFWKLTAFRLLFVVVFQNVVTMCVLALKVIIPDIPKNLQKRISRENHLTNEIIIKQEMLRARDSREHKDNGGVFPVKSRKKSNNASRSSWTSEQRFADDLSWDSDSERRGMQEFA